MKTQISFAGSAHLLQTASRLLLLLAICVIPFAQAQAQATTILYDQLNNQKLNSTDSNDSGIFPPGAASPLTISSCRQGGPGQSPKSTRRERIRGLVRRKF